MYAIATSGKRDQSLAETGQLRQRSIYLPIVRGAVPPSLAIFDMPNPDLVTGSRAVTTVPTQALFMMNSPFVRDMSQAVSQNLAKQKLNLEAVIEQMYQSILVRDPDQEDLAVAQEYIQGLIDQDKTKVDALSSFVQILFSSAEFRLIE